MSDGHCDHRKHGALKKILEDYNPVNIFNVDENRFYLFTKSLTLKSDKYFSETTFGKDYSYGVI